MASILESYEKQYGNLTSEITAKLNNIARLEGGDRKPEIAATSRLFEETRELLEQMGLEIQELPGDQRPKYSTRIQSYRQELDRLAQEFRRPRYGLNAPSNSAFDETGLREELLVDSDMRAGLLTNTERVERTGRRLQEGLRTAYETEEIGGQILSDLDHQRDTLQRSRDRLRHANEDLSKSSRIISSMYRRLLRVPRPHLQKRITTGRVLRTAGNDPKSGSSGCHRCPHATRVLSHHLPRPLPCFRHAAVSAFDGLLLGRRRHRTNWGDRLHVQRCQAGGCTLTCGSGIPWFLRPPPPPPKLYPPSFSPRCDAHTHARTQPANPVYSD